MMRIACLRQIACCRNQQCLVEKAITSAMEHVLSRIALIYRIADQRRVPVVPKRLKHSPRLHPDSLPEYCLACAASLQTSDPDAPKILKSPFHPSSKLVEQLLAV